MSELIYPNVRGLQPEIVRTPLVSNVIKTASSGKEIRNKLYAAPRYKFVLDYGYLKDYDNSGIYSPASDFRTLLGFFNDRLGDFDSFYFNDPDDVMDNLPAGDGATTAFTTQRNYNGRAEAPDNFQYLPVILQGVGGNMENLCKWGTQFENAAWTKTGVTVTADSIANPFGVVNADTLTPTTTTGTAWQSGLFALPSAFPIVRGVTFSVYLKAVTTNQTIRINIGDSTAGLGVGGAAFCSVVTSQWTRFSVSYTPTAAAVAAGATVNVQIGDTSGFISTATGGLYVACAQIERQLAASPYVTNGVGAATNSYVFAKSGGGAWQSTFSTPPANAVQLVYGAPSVPLYRVRFNLADMNNGEFDITAIFKNLHSAVVGLIQVNA